MKRENIEQEYAKVLDCDLNFWGTSIEDVISNAHELVVETGGTKLRDLLWAIAHVAERDLDHANKWTRVTESHCKD